MNAVHLPHMEALTRLLICSALATCNRESERAGDG